MMVVKEEFVGGEKYTRAMKLGGSDAIVMWVALKCYASKHPASEGFIPDEDVDDLQGAPRRPRKALQSLVECGRRLVDGKRGPGLVDPVPGGWKLHDYLDHSVSPEDEELRREKARLKKQRQREEKRKELEQLRRGDVSRGQQGDTTRDSGGRVPEDVPRTPLAGVCPPAPVPTRAGARPQPSPPQPTFKTPPPPLRSNHQDPCAREGSPTPVGLVLEPAAARPKPSKPAVDPVVEHRRFASDYGLNLDDIVADCNADPGFEALAAVEKQRAITKALMDAAAERERA
jgi:hypothetical protein